MKHGTSSHNKMSKRGSYAEGHGKVQSFGNSGCKALEAGASKTNPMGKPGRVNSKERSKMNGKGY